MERTPHFLELNGSLNQGTEFLDFFRFEGEFLSLGCARVQPVQHPSMEMRREQEHDIGVRDELVFELLRLPLAHGNYFLEQGVYDRHYDSFLPSESSDVKREES